MISSTASVPCDTPVLFLVFNRPTTTRVVFEAIRKAKPTKLYIAADGPRYHKKGESEKCLEVRTIVLDVDWECEVHTLFREDNLGCGEGVSSAITWFFDHEPEGIILEDDCLPCPDFFTYCAELLERYRHDTRIMGIGGTNLVPDHIRKDNYSYSFSNHNNIWGWATWRRAWDFYDYEMSQYKKVIKKGYLKSSFASTYESDYFHWVFERTFLFPAITWDYQWEFVRRVNSGLTIMPKRNLISNLGFGDDATHTTNSSDPSSELSLEKLNFPLSHPESVMVNTSADRIAFINHHTTFESRAKTIFKSWLPESVRTMLFKKSMHRFVESYNGKPIIKTIPKTSKEKLLERYSSPNFR
jgi:hypothetical protein